MLTFHTLSRTVKSAREYKQSRAGLLETSLSSTPFIKLRCHPICFVPNYRSCAMDVANATSILIATFDLLLKWFSLAIGGPIMMTDLGELLGNRQNPAIQLQL